MLRRISIQLSFCLIFFKFFYAHAEKDIAIITNQEANLVDIIDLKERKKILEVSVGSKPAGIFVDEANKIFFTSNPGTNNISMFEMDTKKHTFLVSGKSPMGIQLLSKKNLLFVSNWFENKISVIDVNKNQIKKEYKVGNSPAGIFLSNEKELFVAIKGENIVTVIDILSQKKIKDIRVGKAPYGVFSDSSTRLLFVTNVQSNTITVIDKKTLKVNVNI